MKLIEKSLKVSIFLEKKLKLIINTIEFFHVYIFYL